MPRAIGEEEILTGKLQELSWDLNKKAICHNILLGGMFGLVFDIPSRIVMSERLISLMNYEEQVTNHISHLGICFHCVHQCRHSRFHGES